ncbi:autotransporter-associated beta strand protein [Azospirillum agricola]|uniref:Ig-like domain-containing protein n=1 Tax=Azospirillum agricola TaxID=1720247 RepID=UPI001F278C12|nr:Ig-like domain-containing protein [Azospirillum agricola]MBP2230998.1 autotransporter-associated beta strand protein [Azospirillum agricola]
MSNFYVEPNVAPVLDANKTPVLTNENQSAAVSTPTGAVGTLVSSLVSIGGTPGNVTDSNAGAVTGIALTGTANSNGTWYYTTDGGANWSAVGTVNAANSLLLAADANTRLFFKANTDYTGTITNAISFRAWDQTSGTAGSKTSTVTTGNATAFSTAADFADITVVDDAPVILSVSVPSNGTYKAGDVLTFTVNTSESVTVTGTPRLALDIGGTVKYAQYTASGSTATALKFTYTVESGLSDTDGISVTGALQPNNGTLQEITTNHSDLTTTLNNLGSLTNVKVDSAAPSFDVLPSAVSVTVSGFTPSASIDEAGTIYYVVVASGATAPSAAQVVAGHNASDTTPLAANSQAVASGPYTSSFSAVTGLSASTAYDVYMVAVDNLNNMMSSPAMVTITTAPAAPGTPTLDSASDSGASGDGKTNVATPTFTVTGVSNGATVTLFNDANNNGVVDAGEELASGTAGGTSISLTVGSAIPEGTYANIKAIQTIGGQPSAASTATSLTIDTTAPTIGISVIATDDRINGTEDDSAVTIQGTTSGVEDGQTVTVHIGTVTKTVTVSSNGWSTTLTSGEVQALSEGSITVTADVSDVAGNAATQATRSITYDRTAPTVSSVGVPTDATYRAGQTLSFTINAPENITVTGTPRIALTIGSSTVYATYQSGGGGTALVFSYTIQTGDLDADGITVGALELNGGTLADAAGNAMTLAFTAPGTSGVRVDGVAPTVTSITWQTPSTLHTNADTLVYRVTFSEALAATPSASDFSVSGTTATVTSVTSVGGNAYDVTVSGGDLAGYNGDVSLGFANNQGITDSAGNALTATTPTGTDQRLHKLDNTAPGAPGTAIALASGSDTGSSSSDAITSATAPVLRVSLNATNAVAGDTLELLLGGGALTHATAKVLDATDISNGYVDFTVTSGDLGADGAKIFTARVTDAAGNVGNAGGSLTVTLDTAGPTTSVTRPTLSSPSGSSAFTVTVTYSENIDASTVSASNVTITGPAALTVTNTSVSGNTVTYTVTPNSAWNSATDAGSYSVALGANPVKDTAGNPVTTLTHSFNVTYNAAPVIGNLAADSVAWAGAGNTVALDLGGNATVSDAENNSVGWGGGSLTVQRVTGGSADATAKDVFSLNGSGFTVDGTTLKDSGAVIFGNVTTNSGGVLTITFNANATSALVQTVMRNVLYANDTPYGNATIRFALSDGSGNTTDADVTVTSSTIYVDQATDDSNGNAADGFSLREALARSVAQTGTPDTIVIAIADSSSITLGSNVTLGSGDTLDFGTTSGVTVSGSAIQLAGSATVIVASDKTATVTSTVSGGTSLTKDGGGTLTLSGSGTNSYAGTTIKTGTLAVAGDGNLGTGTVTLQGGTLAVTGATTIDNTITLTANSTIRTDAAVTVSGNISGPVAGLTKTGNGTLTLTGHNTYGGATTISAGGLTANSATSAIDDTSTVTVAAGATFTVEKDEAIASIAGAGSVVLNAVLTTADNTSNEVSGVISGSGSLITEGTGTLTLSGANTYTGTTTVQYGGTLVVAGDGNLGGGTLTLNGGTLTVTGAGTIDNGIVIGSQDATVNTSAAVTLSGVISGNNLTKTGSGTLTLSNANTYTGSTTVSAGTLLLTGSLGNGAVSVASGATLGGTGTIGGNVTVASGATLAPGVAGSSNGIGTLSVGGNLTMNGILAIELAGASSYDKVSVSGTVTINGSSSGTTGNNFISVTRVNGYAATNTTYAVINNTGSSPISTTFPSLAEGGTLTTNGDLYTVSYAAGTGSDDLVLTAVVNPTVTSVSATTADGTYKAGDTVTITVTFNRAVTVTGSPTLSLGTGRTATYTGGSGGTTLSFTYTVQAGDSSADLDYASTTALSLNGGSIVDGTTSMAATLTLAAPGAANSLGANKAIVIDTTTPAVTAVAVPADATYATGQTMDFTVTFSEAVTVTGTPTLPITLDNGEVVQATYLSGSGGTALTFRYTVGSGKLDTDGIVLGSALSGGTIADAAGNAATLTLANVVATAGVRIDSVGPTVAAVSSSTADGTYGTGDTITIEVSFSEAVTVSGTPTLTLNTGRVATYSGGSGGSVLTFTYVVQAGDTTADLDAGSLALNGGVITDTTGNPATLALPGGGASLAGGKAIVVDTTPPSVVGVSVPADGAYTVGKTLSVTVQLSEAVIVNGTPTILLDIGGVQRVAVYNPAGSSGTALRFDYVVQAGDNDADGITVKELALNGASITDAARLALPATLGGIPGTQGVLVDTLAPDAPSVPVLAAGQDSGSSATDGLTNVDRPTIGGTAEPGSTVTVMIDGVARGTTTAGPGGAWSFTVTDPLTDGAHSITTTATDRAGNVSPASPALALVIDATPPVLSTPSLAPGSDSGVSATDRITGVTRPTLTGSAEPNSSVRVILDGVVIGTATAGADGRWSFTVADALADGDHSVATEATDVAGNTGRSASQTFTIRSTAPGAPSAPTLASGDSGASATDGLTSTTRPVLTGIAPPNGTVTVYVDGTAVGTVRTDATGVWNLPLNSPLTDGTHQVQASATDAAGNVGTQRSQALVLTIDTQAPTVTAGGTSPSLTSGGTVAVGAGISLSDANTLDRVVVSLTNAQAGDELVIGALPGGITASRDGNRIVLSGVASAADYQAAVRAIGLRSSAADPSFGGTATSRSITVSARDAAGNESGATTVSVSVPATAVPPPPPAATPVTTISGNGPSTNTSSGSSSTGSTSTALPSLPGGSGAASGNGPMMGSSGTDAGRSVTLGSVGGSSASTDAGRSVTLGSVGGASSSTDAGRSVTLGSVGGQNSGGSSSSSSGLSGGSGSTGSSGGSPLAGGFGGGFGGGLGSGLGGVIGGAQSPFSGPIGPRTGLQPSAGAPQNGNAQGPGTNGQRTTPNPGNAPAGDGQNREPQGQPQDQQPQGQQPQGQPEGGEGGDDAPGGTAPQGTGADGKPADRADAAPVGRVAPGFAQQVARAHGGPAGASALLAALANHTLPGSRAA